MQMQSWIYPMYLPLTIQQSRGIVEICKICEERSIEIKVFGTNDKVHKFLENIGVDNSIIE